MNQTDWDVVIVGGGLSGLSLAVELAQPAFKHLRVLVLEKRSHYTRDRTWSYWATQAHRYSALERRRWNSWRVSFAGQLARQTSSVPYCSLDADVFYDFAVAQIAAAPHVQLRMNACVSELTGGEYPTARLDDGSVVSAKRLMDARPPTNPNTNALSQHFSGWEINTDTDSFNADTVELMDFQQANSGLHFFYVLPYSPRQALVESTWISANHHRPDYAAEIQAYLNHRYGIRSAKPTYSEYGRLDLQMPQATIAGNRITPLGRGAGTLRPSTGFAFLETVADAKRIASYFDGVPQDAIGSVRIAPYKRPAVDLWMDEVFLRAIMSDWPRAPEYFMAMFKGVESSALVSFLSGNPALVQRLQVVKHLPKLPLMRAALQQMLA